MSLDFHELPAREFDLLAAGGNGPAAIAALKRAQYSKHMLLLRGVADASGAPSHAAAYDLLARAQRQAPEAAASTVAHPSVGAWAHRTMRALRGEPVPADAAQAGPDLDGLAAVAGAAAIRAGLAAQIEVPVRDGRVVLPSLGIASLPQPPASLTHAPASPAQSATLRSTSAGAEIALAGTRVLIPADRHASAPGWQPLRPLLTAPFELLIDDGDPYRMPAAPDLIAVPDLAAWRPLFQDAVALLERRHQAVAAEVAALVKVVVPLGRPPHGQVSSSSPETFGAIALSAPVDTCSLAVTLTHEVQHVKLSALLDVLPLTRPDDGRRYYAPWREDPRPVSGLLQGAYAYLGVTSFWHRQRAASEEGTSRDAELLADSEFARWRSATAGVTEVLLTSGGLTSHGERFARGMAAALRACLREPVPDAAQRVAAAERDRHLARWQSAHGPIPAAR
ncbi:MAG TPA: HEXXH motif domain-containing protein [Streptosporangiaceae bacterium]|nr:HEXXH motif domain-containing protein [Streptosporangiaceae bacterium]